MRVYLSARYGKIDEMRNHAKELRDLGHHVTSSWLRGTIAPSTDLSDPAWPTIAQQDVNDVFACDAVIYFAEADRSSGGRHVEFGMGLGLGKRMMVVGEPEHLFHTLPTVEVYSDWGETLHVLGPV